MKIKVIKKKDAESVNKTLFPAPENKRRDERREIISTVAGWIDEFQRGRCEKSEQGFEWPFAALRTTAQSS